jgi:hypothetical protein
MRIEGIYGVEEIVGRLADEDILGQLLERRGKMAELAKESGDIKLDWVDGVEIALENPSWFTEEAGYVEEILKEGIRNVIWAGMGGSVQTIYTMKRMGLLDSPGGSIFPCDNTDPQFLSDILLRIAEKEGIEIGERISESIQELLKGTMMIGVAFGMTSEEPITHLEWFSGMMEEAGVRKPEAHIQVMTIPGSFLDAFAKGRGSRMIPLQLDGENHTSGRMSAPTTRVFIRPLAFMLGATGKDIADGLRRTFSGIQQDYGIYRRMDRDDRMEFVKSDPFIALGAFVHRKVEEEGRNKLVLFLPDRWMALAPWFEQLVEESLGKGGKGFLVFYGEPADPEIYGEDVIFLNVRVGGKSGLGKEEEDRLRSKGHPVLLLDMGDGYGWEDEMRILGSFFAKAKLSVVTFGYLQDIPFAGQPAVEAYKAYARRLRESEDPFPIPKTDYKACFGGLTLFYNSLVEKGLIGIGEMEEVLREIGGSREDAPSVFAASLIAAKKKGVLGYLDLTYNGYMDDRIGAALKKAKLEIANKALHIRGKVRVGPSDYHSTEQSETDGPYELVSLRIVAMSHKPVIFGKFDDRFLLAQARGTWQAMEDAGRWILMMTLKDSSGESVDELEGFFGRVEEILRSYRGRG